MFDQRTDISARDSGVMLIPESCSGVFVLLAVGPAKKGADEDTEYEKELVGRTIRGPVAKTELEPGQLSWLADAIEGGDAAGAEFVRWANDLAEAEEIQRAIALASKQGAK